MLLQTPGSFILVYVLASQPGNNLFSWITYCFTGTLQMMLLIMCLIFGWRERNARRISRATEDSEETLLYPKDIVEDNE